jgi:diguanylate cyclase (GGDEF)-like protein
VATSSVVAPTTRGHRARFGPAFLVLALGLVLTLVTWQMARGELGKLRQAQFDARTTAVQDGIQARMLAYEQILLGGVGLINTLGTVKREQWATYVASLDIQTNYPGVQGVGYAEYVPHLARDAFLRRMLTPDLPLFQIRPAGDRNAYAPVTYLEPRTDRNIKALGFDMLSDPTRQAAMLAARDSGRVAISARLKLASEPNQSPAYGFLVYVPVYISTLPQDSVDARRLALKGFVNSPFRMADLVNGILSPADAHIQVSIYDGDAPNPDTLLFSTQPQASAFTAEAPFTRISRLKLHNRTWTVTFLMPATASGAEGNSVLLVLVAGGLISLLLSALTLSITARVGMIQHSEKHYFQLANFDSLTGLPNRAMFRERLSQTLLQRQRTQQKFAVIYLDLDYFKAVNDKHGHAAGDHLLKEVAGRLQHCMRKADTVARLGGDEFVVILHEIRLRDDAGVAAKNMLEALSKPIVLPSVLYNVSVSMGIAIYPGDGLTEDDLLKHADRAMYASKTQGRNRYCYFTSDLQDLSFDTHPGSL